MAVMLVVGVASMVQASVLVSQSFNGFMPTDGWTFLDNGAILTNNGPESLITDIPGGKSLNVDMTTAGIPKAYKNITVSGVDTGLAFRISFDYNPADYSWTQHAFFLRGDGGQNAIHLALQSANDGTVANFGGSSLGMLDQDSWYHVEIVAVPQNNAGADTYDLTITDTNGTAVISASDLPFRTDVDTYDELRWYCNAASGVNDGAFYIDNVDVRTTTIEAPTNMTSIIDEDFNTPVTSGTAFSDENFNGEMPTEGWTFLDNGAVLTNNGPESLITEMSGGKSLNVDITSDGVPQAWKNVAVSGDDADLDFRIAFDYNPADFCGSQHIFILRGNGSSANAIQLSLQQVVSGSQVGVQNHNGSVYESSLGLLTEGDWYHVEITAVPQNHSGEDTYDLTITDTNGTAVVSAMNLEFRTDVSSYDQLQWRVNTGTPGEDGAFYIDNVDVQALPYETGFDLIAGADLAGPESGFTGIGDGASIRLYDVTNASNPVAEAFFEIDNADASLYIVFDYYADRRTGENTAFRLQDENAWNAVDGVFGVAGIKLMDMWNDTGLYNHNGSTMVSLGLVLDEDAWYRFKIKAVPESTVVKTYDLTIYDASGMVVGNYTELPFSSNIDSYDSVGWFFNNFTNSVGDSFFVDNVMVGTTLPGSETPATLWNDWLTTYAANMGGLTNLTDDADGDLLSNLAEYGMGGDPSVGADPGNMPVSSMVTDGSLSYFEVVYYMRDDASGRGLSYSLETDTDLVAAPGWVATGYEIMGTNTATGISGFDAVTNRIPTDAEQQQFIRLQVELTP
jgi:hypothetical protein